MEMPIDKAFFSDTHAIECTSQPQEIDVHVHGRHRVLVRVGLGQTTTTPCPTSRY